MGRGQVFSTLGASFHTEILFELHVYPLLSSVGATLTLVIIRVFAR